MITVDLNQHDIHTLRVVARQMGFKIYATPGIATNFVINFPTDKSVRICKDNPDFTLVRV